MSGLTKETANQFIKKALKIGDILGYRSYSHSDFTSIMVGNTQEGDSTWARYIGGSYAIFVAPDRKSHQSKGFRGYTDEALNVVSNYGKIGLSIDWGGGAGGRNTRTELATKFFGGYYDFSRCLQEAFGGPRSDSWKNEEVALKFIAWAENINNIGDIIKTTSLKKNKDLFNKLKAFIVDWTLAIEELAKDPKYSEVDSYLWSHDKERAVAKDALQHVTIPEEFSDIKDLSIESGSYGGYIIVSGKSIFPIFRETTSGDIKCFWQQSSDTAPKPIKTPDDLINWIGTTIKFTNTFDPATFLS